MEAKAFASACLQFCSLLLYLATHVHCQCVITGCASGECYMDGGQSKCRLCLDGYYRTSTALSCNPCQSRCKTCELFAQCSSCKTGYYLDTAQSFCGSCPNKCLDCDSPNSCVRCEEGLSFNATSGECTDGTATAAAAAAAPKKKSSLVGQIIGYCVSGVVLILCCTITLLHQKRKQEEEEAARKQYKLEQEKLQAANQHKDELGDVVGEWELDSLKKNPQIHADFVGFNPAKAGNSPTKKRTGPSTSSTFEASQQIASKTRRPNEQLPDSISQSQAKYLSDFDLHAGQSSPTKVQMPRPSAGAHSQYSGDQKLATSWQTGTEAANNSPTLKVMVKKPKDSFGLNIAPNEPQTHANSGAKSNSRVSAFGAPKF